MRKKAWTTTQFTHYGGRTWCCIPIPLLFFPILSRLSPWLVISHTCHCRDVVSWGVGRRDLLKRLGHFFFIQVGGYSSSYWECFYIVISYIVTKNLQRPFFFCEEKKLVHLVVLLQNRIDYSKRLSYKKNKNCSWVSCVYNSSYNIWGLLSRHQKRMIFLMWQARIFRVHWSIVHKNKTSFAPVACQLVKMKRTSHDDDHDRIVKNSLWVCDVLSKQ